METLVPTPLLKQITKRALLDKYCDILKEQGFNVDNLLESESLDNFPYNSFQTQKG